VEARSDRFYKRPSTIHDKITHAVRLVQYNLQHTSGATSVGVVGVRTPKNSGRGVPAPTVLTYLVTKLHNWCIPVILLLFLEIREGRKRRTEGGRMDGQTNFLDVAATLQHTANLPRKSKSE